MRLVTVFSFIAALGCGTPPPPPEETLENCVDLLIQDPKEDRARSLFPLLLRASDDETMAEMRAHHGTSELQMLGNYPSHQWIHPFLRGNRYMQEGDLFHAESEFQAARAAALKERAYPGTPDKAQEWRLRFACVIAEESRHRIEEIQELR